MPERKQYAPRFQSGETIPFTDGVEAWHWFYACQAAKAAGARIVAGISLTPRPCEPTDIYMVVQRLMNVGKITAAHLRVLKKWAEIGDNPPPDIEEEGRRRLEARHEHKLFYEATDALGEALLEKKVCYKGASGNLPTAG